MPTSKLASAFGSFPVRWKASHRRPDSLRMPAMSRSSDTFACASRASPLMTLVMASARPTLKLNTGEMAPATVASASDSGVGLAWACLRPPPSSVPAMGIWSSVSEVSPPRLSTRVGCGRSSGVSTAAPPRQFSWVSVEPTRPRSKAFAWA